MSIISVQTFSIALGDAVTENDATLAGGTVRANCVPFITSRLSSVGDEGHADEFRHMCVEAYFPTTPTDAVRVERGTAVTGDFQMVVEVTVVEFDGTDIEVQQGAYAMADTESSDVIGSGDGLTTTDPDYTFLYHTWSISENLQDDYDKTLVRGRFTGATELTFDRVTGTEPISGRWYVVEDTTAGGEFDVQSRDIALANGDTTGTATALSPAVTENKTFLIGSYKAAFNIGQHDDNESFTVDVKLNSTTEIALSRAHTNGGVLDWHGYAVSMADSTTVYRGTLTTSAASPDPAGHTSIGATVVVADSWVHVAGSSGSCTGGSHTGAASQDVGDAFLAWTFFSTTQIDCEHSTFGGESGGSCSWEVIEWDVGASAPARRVMVVS